MIVASYHQTSRYHRLPLAQMQAAEALSAAGDRYAEVGREFIAWALEDLKIYARRSYDPGTGQFIAMMIDGTPLQWRKAKTGYYTPESFAPADPDAYLLWSFAMAYRLSGEDAHWNMARKLGQFLGLGELGSSSGEGQALEPKSSHADWRLIYALLELHRATNNRALLQAACRIADTLLSWQTPTGLFPRPGREYARTGDEVPQALLHLAAALQGSSRQMPRPAFDTRFFHCEYHGELAAHQRKRGDNRTLDNLVFYGSP